MGKGKNYSSNYNYYSGGKSSAYSSSSSGQKTSFYSSYSYSSHSGGGSSSYSYSSQSGGQKPAKPSSSHYANKPVVYSLNLDGGRKYVGKTNNFAARMDQHFSGNGAKWTQQNKPVSINHAQVCRSDQTASRAEAIVYHNMSNYHGKSKVRGAGHTKTT